MRHNAGDNLLEVDEQWATKWSNCQENLKSRIPDPFYSAFIAPLVAEKDGLHMRLVVPDKVNGKHVEQHYKGIIEEVLREHLNIEQVSLMKRQPLSTPSIQKQAPIVKSFLTSMLCKDAVDSLFTKTLPPLVFISGPTGCGKSELAKSILGNEAAKGKKAIRMTLEQFVTDFAASCKVRGTVGWRSQLRAHQTLILDDFHFIKKTAHRSQEEIRHLCDDFVEQGNTLILLSSVESNHLPLSEDLSSRLHGATNVTLPPLDLPVRISLLKRNLAIFNSPLPETLLDHIAKQLKGDGRLLLAVAKAISSLSEKPKTLDQVDFVISRFASVRSIPGTAVLDAVSKFTQVTHSELTGPSRDKRTVGARHLAAYLLQRTTDMNTTQVAHLLGRSDHTSIVYALKQIRKKLSEDLFWATQIDSLERQIRDCI